MSANTRRYRLKNPEKIKIARKIQYDKRKIKTFNLIGGPVCKRCGCDELQFLEVNHINGGGCKEWRSTNRGSVVESLATGKRKPEGLEVLCRVCNALDFLEHKNPVKAALFRIFWPKKYVQKN